MKTFLRDLHQQVDQRHLTQVLCAKGKQKLTLALNMAHDIIQTAGLSEACTTQSTQTKKKLVLTEPGLLLSDDEQNYYHHYYQVTMVI